MCFTRFYKNTNQTTDKQDNLTVLVNHTARTVRFNVADLNSFVKTAIIRPYTPEYLPPTTSLTGHRTVSLIRRLHISKVNYYFCNAGSAKFLHPEKKKNVQ